MSKLNVFVVILMILMIITFVGSALVLAFYSIEGWGWFLFSGFVGMYVLHDIGYDLKCSEMEKKDEQNC